MPFEQVKKMLCKWPLLFRFNPEKLTYVMTDASEAGQRRPFATGVQGVVVVSMRRALGKGLRNLGSQCMVDAYGA